MDNQEISMITELELLAAIRTHLDSMGYYTDHDYTYTPKRDTIATHSINVHYADNSINIYFTNDQLTTIGMITNDTINRNEIFINAADPDFFDSIDNYIKQVQRQTYDNS